MKNFDRSRVAEALSGLALMFFLANGAVAETSKSSAAFETTTTRNSAGAESSTTETQSLKFKISSRVNDMYPNNNIEVSVFNQNILLTGQVTKSNIKESVAKVTGEMAPNYKILNYLTVGRVQKAEQSREDALITVKVTSKLLTVSGVQTGNVKVVTTNGTVYLLGTVTKNQSVAIMNNIKPIKNVKSIVNLFQYAE